MHGCEQEKHFERRLRGDDRGRNDQHGMESVTNADQRRSPPEDPLPSTKPTDSVRSVATDSPASPI
ncbi:unnamed protein product [Brugia pahangi]|uniref:Uncharacterized protein n=1 Tax=Brugia pahangi TaxID=6280 RepID=A0A0N4T8Q4_BRUPA|nr:unnamed protein product [Brugia pahangi]